MFGKLRKKTLLIVLFWLFINDVIAKEYKCESGYVFTTDPLQLPNMQLCIGIRYDY